ncbi:hypothetical protein ACHAWF_011942 [Thalassiosira exigua]
MSRDRGYSTASSGYGSEDHPNANNHTPRRKKKNDRQGGRDGNPCGHRYHDMTLLCHRVDLFDEFVPSSGKKSGGDTFAGGLVPIRCLGADRGCACRTPCTFCHTVVENYDEVKVDALPADGESDVNPKLAFLFGGSAITATKNPRISEDKEKAAPPITKSTISSTLVVDPIFAKNHGLLSDDVEGGVRVKKYHHPPVGKYRFKPPLMELPKFFSDAGGRGGNGHLGHTQSNNHNEKTDESGGGLDSFFDDFAVAPKSNAPQQTKPKQNKDYDERVMVFRAPLKTVVKSRMTSGHPGWTGKCYCQSRYENLIKGSAQQNPHDSTVVHDKYWAQRRRLFKKFDEGIRLDAEGWYSVTPEAVADHVASRFADIYEQLVHCPTTNQRDTRACRGNRRSGPNKIETQSMVILDAFCGCGGNGIAFAKLPSSVVSLIICVDVDREKLRMAAHNASIYCIPPNRIIFVEANSVALMERCYRDGKLIMDPPPRTAEALAAYPPREVYDDFTIGGIDMLSEYAQHIDAVFIDPPWGGVDYGAMGKDGYDLARDMRIRGCERGCVGFPPMPEVDGVHLLKIAAAATSTRFVAYDLPRNANKRSLAAAALEAGYEGNSKLEEHYLNGRLKTVTAYFGQDFRHLLDLKKHHKGECV